ncbi:lasso peptide biosynthesis B2 protein [Streptomyces sp. B1866]|uniref:lasso peptide biosynthesis B2 protein n=1 Tax=Streptomyces sp. B1866 TaxID=3075431 RepID=UPI00288DC856|nr:lasso peptide biosynthesis B2 protein [Streptomyces sp. B1866]MDT3397424.1 lasso peptide biosynthesis B2 protein [Streptomyces sp. B1866]
MSFPVALPPRVALGPRTWLLARACGLIASRIATRPERMDRAVRRAQRSARPSSPAQAERAVLAVCTATIRLGGTAACLTRSLAALLYCRAHGHTPALIFGIRPGTAQVHAWLEADGHPVAEPSNPCLLYTPVTRYPSQEINQP